jgi:hypothetical protein
MYNTALPSIFGVPKYAAALMKVVADRKIQLNTRYTSCFISTRTCTFRHVLKEVVPEKREAIFDVLDENNKVKETKSVKVCRTELKHNDYKHTPV